jgi:hypothetical protein
MQGADAPKPPCKAPPPPALASNTTTTQLAANSKTAQQAQAAINDCDKLVNKISAAMGSVGGMNHPTGSSGMGATDAKAMVGELKKITLFVRTPDGRKIKVYLKHWRSVDCSNVHSAIWQAEGRLLLLPIVYYSYVAMHMHVWAGDGFKRAIDGATAQKAG